MAEGSPNLGSAGLHARGLLYVQAQFFEFGIDVHVRRGPLGESKSVRLALICLDRGVSRTVVFPHRLA